MLSDSVAWNIISVWLIQKLKLSPSFSWISETTPWISRLLSGFAATLTTAGMSVSWQMVGGSGTLTISGITYASVAMFVWICVKNYGFQHVIYQAAFKPKPASIEAETAVIRGNVMVKPEFTTNVESKSNEKHD